MERNKDLIIMILIVIFVVICVVSYFHFDGQQSLTSGNGQQSLTPGNGQQSLTLGNTKFLLPEGYTEADKTPEGAITIVNGTNSIYMSLRDSGDLKDIVYEYADVFNKDNRPATVTDLNIDNVTVYKISLENNTNDFYYWFENNGDTYCLYCWDGNPNIDSLIFELVQSMENP